MSYHIYAITLEYQVTNHGIIKSRMKYAYATGPTFSFVGHD